MQFFTFQAAYAKLKHEGWLFINRSDKYQRNDPVDGSYMSHAVLYPEFASEIERIVQNIKRAELENVIGDQQGSKRPGVSFSSGSSRRRVNHETTAAAVGNDV